MRVAVLGAGNGGCGVAFDWAQHGHQVSLFNFPEFPGASRRWPRGAGSAALDSSKASLRSPTPDSTSLRLWTGPTWSSRSARRTAPSLLRPRWHHTCAPAR
jgi:glycine/D-amino acid oxidase-like deaminating enzyme